MKKNKQLIRKLSVILAFCLALPFGAFSFADATSAVDAADEADLLRPFGDVEDEAFADGEGACSSFYIGKGTTDSGSYFWGRTEDTTWSYTKLLEVHPAETHEPGDMYESGNWNNDLTVFTPVFRWPYPEKTLRYTLCRDSIYNMRQGHEPYAEVGTNEKGVSISATVSLNATKQAITNLDPAVSRNNGGLTETDITSVILMQAETAREAVELTAKIIDTVGAGGREGVMFSDANEVWYFQWLTGHQYVAVKCPDDMVGFSPNITANVGDKDGYVDVTDTANVVVSPGFVSIPKEAGELVAKDNDTKVKVADTYSGARQNFQAGRLRVAYGYYYGYKTQAEIEANLPAEPQYLDYFVPPQEGRKYTLYEALRLLACRGEGTEWENANPTGNGASIGCRSNLEAHVFENRPGMVPELATIEWLSLAPPEFGVYLPFYGSLVTDVFEKAYSPDPNSREYNNADPNANSMYWVFRELYERIAEDGTLAGRERLGNGVRAFWERYQKSLIAQQATVDALMANVLDVAGLEAAERVATDLSMAISEEAYEYAKWILAELKAFKAAGTTGNFIPSALLDKDALPTYAHDMAQYGGLIDLLLEITALDGTEFDQDAWEALMEVYEEAWAFVFSRPVFSAPNGGLVPLATIEQDILDMLRRLLEAYYDLLYGIGATQPTHSFGDEMGAGAFADVPEIDLDIESLVLPNGAKFILSVKDFKDVSYVHLAFSFDHTLFNYSYALSDYLDGAGFIVERTPDVEDAANIRKVSMYLTHENFGGIAAGGSDIEVLYVYLTPKTPFNGNVSIMFNHIDVSYDETGAPKDADVLISPPVAVTRVNYFSLYDINRDGKVTLADVDIVRRNMDKTKLNTPSWDDPANWLLRRSDVNRNDAVGMDDLLLVITAYEATL